jgi:hypothetical protein
MQVVSYINYKMQLVHLIQYLYVIIFKTNTCFRGTDQGSIKKKFYHDMIANKILNENVRMVRTCAKPTKKVRS